MLDRHGPVLAEGTTEDSVVTNLNDGIPNPNVDNEASQSKLELGKLATTKVRAAHFWGGKKLRLPETAKKEPNTSLDKPGGQQH